MNHTKIVELFIDDMNDESGIEAISLVSRPAHDEKWLAFQHEEVEKLDSPYHVVDEDFCSNNPSIFELGEPYSKLINEGWEICRVERMNTGEVNKLYQEFVQSNPNAESREDENNPYRVRYKYVGPRDDLNRNFCREMLSANRVYTIEDIERLSNPQFGKYSVFLYRGSYNCRHQFVRLLYRREGTIANTGRSRGGLQIEEGLGPIVQPDTRPQATIDSAIRGSRKDGSPSVQWKPGQPRAGSVGTFSQRKPFTAKQLEYEFQESIDDYPEAVKNAAKRAVDYAEKNGWGSCGTNVGKIRASQLAKGEKISPDTIKRMYSYLTRHKVDLESSKSYDDGCGKLMYDSWGGEAALKWAERKLEQLKKEKMSASSKMVFFDDEKRIIVGAAMVPNKMIHRYDSFGNLYYVFFSKKSIKKMSEKFLKQRRTDETSIEHDGMKLGADKVWITESWVSEDPIKDKSAAYGFNLPSGSWFVSMKVEDDKVWEMIKKKALTGFSVEGLFAEKSVFTKQ